MKQYIFKTFFLTFCFFLFNLSFVHAADTLVTISKQPDSAKLDISFLNNQIYKATYYLYDTTTSTTGELVSTQQAPLNFFGTPNFKTSVSFLGLSAGKKYIITESLWDCKKDTRGKCVVVGGYLSLGNQKTSNVQIGIITTGETIPAGIHTDATTDKIIASGAVYSEAKGDFKVIVTLRQAGVSGDIVEQLNSYDQKEYTGRNTKNYIVTFDGLLPGKQYTVEDQFTDTNGKVYRNEPVTVSTITGNELNPGASESNSESFSKRAYWFLEPIPGFDPNIPSPAECAETPNKKNCNLGDYISFIIELTISIVAVVLVVKLVISGFTYMTQDIGVKKYNAKNDIITSVIGILLALTSYIILNTINPTLVNNDVTLEKAVLQYEVVNLPDAGDDTVDVDFKTTKATYSTDAKISDGVAAAVQKLNNGWSIAYFKVYTNNRMLIALKKGAEVDVSTVISIGSGKNGFSELNQGTSGDKKTPKGKWKIIDIRKPKVAGQPVFNRQGSNMGAAFFHLSPTVNGERGIGMHGNKNGTLTGTLGCIRMKNADIIALLPYIKTGTEVHIGI